MQLKFKLSAAALAAISLSQVASAGPIAYGICQTGASSPPQSYDAPSAYSWPRSLTFLPLTAYRVQRRGRGLLRRRGLHVRDGDRRLGCPRRDRRVQRRARDVLFRVRRRRAARADPVRRRRNFAWH